ncbi:MSC_0882 family membrane protein [Ureaplasma urealyticum]|uniref:ABC transporter permease n=1 Tax=Ureaplasma urealyticum TaxID=2130 RepID=A0AAX1QZ24_UREUR|nr:membrane protein [Ureaplasma urealyticum]EDT49517.1 putative membrane protein [Ureaplasma urealyticum serovar 13 str. ATCC 33698]RCJ01383.1 hypothetical protein DSQ42_01045 [Ureaplasma urealyticum]
MPRINTQVFNENDDKNTIKNNNDKTIDQNKIRADIEHARLLETKEYNANFYPSNDPQYTLIKKQDDCAKLKPTLNFDDGDQLITIAPTQNYANLKLRDVEVDQKNSIIYEPKKELINQNLIQEDLNNPHLSVSQKPNGFIQKTKSFIPQNISEFIYHNEDIADQNQYENNLTFSQLEQKVNQKNTPDFYLKEIHAIRNKIIVWTMLLAIGMGLLFYLVYEVVVNHFNPWIFLPVSVYCVLMIFFLALSCSNFANFKKEMHYQQNNFDRTKATNFIVGIYRKLVVMHINVNWIASYLYLTSLFMILGVFVVSYFMNLYYNAAIGSRFGDLIVKIPAIVSEQFTQKASINKNPLWAIIGLGVILGLTFIIHLWLIFNAHHRVNRIQSYYVNEIISGEEIIQLKKQANRRGLVIFLVLSIILGLIFYLMYTILKRKYSIKK